MPTSLHAAGEIIDFLLLPSSLAQIAVIGGAALLDGTVAFRKIEAVRGAGGAPGLRRTYVFDYTRDGSTRQQGFVILTGHSVDSVGL